jgi:hypothetical protein
MRNLIITKPAPCAPRPSGAEDAAAALLASVPASAKAIALAMHERAAWGYDEALEAHWAAVLRLVEAARMTGQPVGSRQPAELRSRSLEPRQAEAVGARSCRSRRPWTFVGGALASCQALITLAALALLAVPGIPRAAQLDPEDVMVQEFQSFCVDYYTPAQCTGAIRFVLKTSGSQYFERLHYEESVDGFLDQLAVMVKGGEALKAGEALATKEGD